MEQRHRVVPGDQHRLARPALHEVGVVGDDREGLAPQPLLGAVLAHPGARLLALAGVGVEVPEAGAPPVRARDLVDADVGVGEGDALDLGPAEAEQLAGRPAHRLGHLLHLQVRLQLALIEVVLRLAQLLGVVAHVPRLERRGAVLLAGDLLRLAELLPRPGEGGRPDLQHQRHGRLGGLGHGVVEPPVGVGRIAEQVRPAGAQLQDLGADGVVVVGVAVVASADPHAPARFAEVAAGGIDQEGLHGRAAVGHQPLAGKPLVLGAGGVAVEQGLGQAGEVLGRLEHQPVLLLVGKFVLAEGGEQGRQTLVERRQLGLQLGPEARAAAHEVGVVLPHQPPLFDREALHLPVQIDLLDAGEELAVLDDLVVEGGEFRRPLQVQRLDGLGVQRRGPDVPERHHPAVGASGVLEGRDGVGEVRRRSVLGDPGDVGAKQGHRLLEGGREQLGTDLVERRDPAMGTGPFGEQRVRRLGHGTMGAAEGPASSVAWTSDKAEVRPPAWPSACSILDWAGSPSTGRWWTVSRKPTSSSWATRRTSPMAGGRARRSSN